VSGSSTCPALRAFHLTGPGAGDWLLGRIAGGLPKPGRMAAYFPDNRGRIVTEMSVACNGEDDFTLITAATAQWHDYEWLARDLPRGSVAADRTRDLSTLIVTGPGARPVRRHWTDADLRCPGSATSRNGGRPPCHVLPAFPSPASWAGRFMPPLRDIPRSMTP
jgi:dimethylglycine dehydrogenase